MGKVKEQLEHSEMMEMKYQVKFMEWLYDTFEPQLLSINDVDDMEKSYGNSSKLIVNQTDAIVPPSSLNNTNYNNKNEKVS